MLEVRPDGAVPVDLVVPWSAGPRGLVQTAGDGLAKRLGQLAQQVVDDLAHHQPRRLLGLAGHDPAEREQIGDEVNVGFDGVEQLGLQQHLAEAEPIEGVLLQHLDDRSGEVLADVAQPAGHAGRRASQAASSVLRTRSLGLVRAALSTVIEQPQGAIHRQIPGAQAAADAVG